MEITYMERSESAVWEDFVIPRYASIPALCRQFKQLGRKRRGCHCIFMDTGGLSFQRKRELVKVIIRCLYQGAYNFCENALEELETATVYQCRDRLCDYGDGIFYIISSENLLSAVTEGKREAVCIGHARTLGNLPFRHINVEKMARYAEELAESLGVPCDSVKEAGVRTVTLHYNCGSCMGAVALIGRSIFYGIEEELYHAYHDAQEDICFDLCGAADMLSVFEILAGSKTGKNIIAVLSFTETASDEGVWDRRQNKLCAARRKSRIMLADAMVRAQNMGAVWLIDLSSLTYACRAEYGDFVTGIFSNDKETGERFRFTAQGLGEPAFALPLDHIYHELPWPECRKKHLSVALAFQRNILRKGVRWIHLDAAGPSVNREDTLYMEKGASGADIAAIAAFVEKELPGEFMM